jgi:hypothetical protein
MIKSSGISKSDADRVARVYSTPIQKSVKIPQCGY